MTTEADQSRREEWLVGNYCVGFIDLLGQRNALHGQGLLPSFESEEQREELHSLMRKTIGPIIKLQEDAEELLAAILKENPTSPLRAQLPPEQQATWDEMQLTRVKMQRWSDGLMSFVCLGDKDVKCRMNGIFAMFGLVGSLCLMGLATRRPIRGSIEVAWAVELHEQELYGAAVARAYELESEIAQYPRIVVGPEALKFLQVHAANPNSDVFSQNDRKLAELCLSMLVQDIDGYWILHYLGNEFQVAVSRDHHAELYGAAQKFIVSQLEEHRAKCNTKLALRYSQLLLYFDAHRPGNPESL